MYLVYALRQITFGDSYIQEVTCPECGFKQEMEIDISEMTINLLDIDSIEKDLIVKLPVNGDELQLKLLSSGDIKRLDKVVKTNVKKEVRKNLRNLEHVINNSSIQSDGSLSYMSGVNTDDNNSYIGKGIQLDI